MLDPVDDNLQLRKLDDLMARLQRLMHVKSAPFPQELTATQAFILRYLDKQEVAKASDIARAVGLSPGAVTQVCDELVRMNVIERTRSETDRRVVQISISQAGRDVLERIRSERTARLFEVVRRMGQPDADEMVRLIGRMVDIVEAMWNEDHKGN